MMPIFHEHSIKQISLTALLQEQLEREALKEKDYSKAAKRLLFLMFTEEERMGRCLVDYKKFYKTTGATVTKCGLADQQKLTALQGEYFHFSRCDFSSVSD